MKKILLGLLFFITTLLFFPNNVLAYTCTITRNVAECQFDYLSFRYTCGSAPSQLYCMTNEVPACGSYALGTTPTFPESCNITNNGLSCTLVDGDGFCQCQGPACGNPSPTPTLPPGVSPPPPSPTPTPPPPSCPGGASCTNSDQCAPGGWCDTTPGVNQCKCGPPPQGGCSFTRCSFGACLDHYYNPDFVRWPGDGCGRPDECQNDNACIPTPTPTPPSCTVAAPNKPILNGPSNGVGLKNLTPTLKWNAIGSFGRECPTNNPGNDGYRVEVFRAPNWSTPFFSTTTNTTTYQAVVNLSAEYIGEYRWRVVASNGSAETASDTWRFYVRPDVRITDFTVTPQGVAPNGPSTLTANITMKNDSGFKIPNNTNLYVGVQNGSGSIDTACSVGSQQYTAPLQVINTGPAGWAAGSDRSVTVSFQRETSVGVYWAVAKVDARGAGYGGNSGVCVIPEENENNNTDKACYTVGNGFSCNGYFQTFGGNVTAVSKISNKFLPPRLVAGGPLQYLAMNLVDGSILRQAGVAIANSFETLSTPNQGKRFSEMPGGGNVDGWNLGNYESAADDRVNIDNMVATVLKNAGVIWDKNTCPVPSQTPKTGYQIICYRDLGVDTPGSFNRSLDQAITDAGANKVVIVMPESSTVANARLKENEIKTVGGQKRIVVIANGNLKFREGSIIRITSNNSGVAFLVNGGINIDPSVTRADGLYIFNGAYNDIHRENAGLFALTTPLLVNGSLIGLGEESFSTGALGRAASGNTSSEEFRYESKYLNLFKDVLMRPKTHWQELSPK